jgi:hypothetical protein
LVAGERSQVPAHAARDVVFALLQFVTRVLQVAADFVGLLEFFGPFHSKIRSAHIIATVADEKFCGNRERLLTGRRLINVRP